MILFAQITPWPDDPWRFLIAVSGDTLHALAFVKEPGVEAEKARLARGLEWRDGDSPFMREATRQLRAYFNGRLREFDLPRSERGTAFEREVWRRVAAIPFGETRTYGGIAAEMGKPGAAVAVGSANAKNPWPIVVPCHRVIGSGGDLRGFAYGLDLKRKLLVDEGALSPAEAVKPFESAQRRWSF